MTTPSQLLIDLLGTNQSTQDRKIQPGEFVELINMRREKAGELVKRNGHTLRSISTFDNPLPFSIESHTGGVYFFPSTPPSEWVFTFNDSIDPDTAIIGDTIQIYYFGSGATEPEPDPADPYTLEVDGDELTITPTVSWTAAGDFPSYWCVVITDGLTNLLGTSFDGAYVSPARNVPLNGSSEPDVLLPVMGKEFDD
jgi:hypothetical protein